MNSVFSTLLFVAFIGSLAHATASIKSEDAHKQILGLASKILREKAVEEFPQIRMSEKELHDVLQGRTSVKGIDAKCSCTPQLCSCCLYIDFEAIHFKHSVCAEIDFPTLEKIELEVKLIVDDKVIFDWKLDLTRNCVTVATAVDLCLDFTKGDGSTLCIDTEVDVVKLPVIKIRFGCINVPEKTMVRLLARQKYLKKRYNHIALIQN